MGGIGVDHVSTPEQPVAHALGTLGQLNRIPVESSVGAHTGGRPAAVLEHGHAASHEGRLGVFAVGQGHAMVNVQAALELQASQRFSGIQRAGGAICVEKAAASAVQPHAIGAPPGARAVAVDVSAKPAYLLGNFQEGFPGPLAVLGQLAWVIRAGFSDQVQVQIQHEGGHIAGQAPQCAAGCTALAIVRVEGQVVHRARVEVIHAEAVGACGQVINVQDQAAGGEVGHIRARDPEDVWGGAGGDLGLEHILVAGAF